MYFKKAFLPSNVMKKIKVLFAINCMNIGGAPSVVFEQMRLLDKGRFEPHLLTLYPSKPANFFPKLDFLPKDHIHEFRLWKRSPLDVVTLWKIYRLLRKERFDVAYTHLFLANFLVRALAVLARVPVVLAFEHSTYFNKSAWQKLCDRLLAKYTDRIIVSTEEVARFTAAQEDLPREKFMVIRNPVSIPSRQDVDIANLRKLTGSDGTQPLFLTIGRFSDEKGQRVLLDAARMVHERHQAARFILVGHGPKESELRSYVDEHDMSKYCVILHEPERAKEFLYIADWFILPSLREGQAIVIEEAMLAGLPVIVSSLPGIGGTVEEGKSGFLVFPGDVEALARAVLRALDMFDRRHEMGVYARAAAERLFSSAERVRALERVVVEALENAH